MNEFETFDEWKTFFFDIYIEVEELEGIPRAIKWLHKALDICSENEMFEECLYISDLIVEANIRALIKSALGDNPLDFINPN